MYHTKLRVQLPVESAPFYEDSFDETRVIKIGGAQSPLTLVCNRQRGGDRLREERRDFKKFSGEIIAGRQQERSNNRRDTVWYRGSPTAARVKSVTPTSNVIIGPQCRHCIRGFCKYCLEKRATNRVNKAMKRSNSSPEPSPTKEKNYSDDIITLHNVKLRSKQNTSPMPLGTTQPNKKRKPLNGPIRRERPARHRIFNESSSVPTRRNQNLNSTLQDRNIIKDNSISKLQRTFALYEVEQKVYAEYKASNVPPSNSADTAGKENLIYNQSNQKMEGTSGYEIKLSRFGSKDISDEPCPTFQFVSAEQMGAAPNIRVRFTLRDGMESRDLALSKDASADYVRLGTKPGAGDYVKLTNVACLNSTFTIEGFNVLKGQSMGQSAPKIAAADKENFSMGQFTPISGLTTFTKDFKILARIVKIFDIKTFNGRNGEGKVFNINVMDHNNDQISMKFFNDAVDEHHHKLEQGKVYVFQKGSVRLADKRFTSIDAEYEISLYKNSMIEPWEDNNEIGSQVHEFSYIRDVSLDKANSFVDLAAVVTEVQDTFSFTSKAGNDLVKREITIADQSDHSIRYTLWNDVANLQYTVGEYLVIKRVKINNYNDQLSLSHDRQYTEIQREPKINSMERVQDLMHWHQSSGALESLKSLTVGGGNMSRKLPDAVFATVEEINNEYNMESGFKDELVYTLMARTASFLVNEGSAYPACSNTDRCKKKVREENNLYYCMSCNTSSNTCVWRYTLHTKFSGDGGVFWSTLFDDQAEKLLGVPAQSFIQMPFEEQKALTQKFELMEFKMMLRAKIEEYNGELKPRFSILNLTPIEESDLIDKMLADITSANA